MFYLTEVKSICNVVEATGNTRLLADSRAWALVEDLHHLWLKHPPAKFETKAYVVKEIHAAWARGDKLLRK